MENILERDRNGMTVSTSDPGYQIIADIIGEAQKMTAQINTGYHKPAEVRRLFQRLTGQSIDETFCMLPPFYTDFGKNIRVGKRVFINHGCTFMDRGGITIGDDALIGPKVNLITTNHPLEPSSRHATISKPIAIGKNAWLGTAATVMPGVTIGENAVIAAGAVVTRDVPANCIAAGVPAAIIKTI